MKRAGFSTSRVDIAEISSDSRGIVKFSNRLLSLDSDIKNARFSPFGFDAV